MAAADGALDPLLDSAPAGFVSFRDDGTITAANCTLAEMVGTIPSDLRGRHIESILAIGSRIFYQTHLFPLLRLHGRADEIFVLLRGNDGSDIGALLNAVRRERDGRTVIDCVLMRVLERRKFEDALVRARQDAEEANTRLQEQAAELEAQGEELQALNEELREQTLALERLRSIADEANQAKSTFLTMMSHELRTPLNAIGGYVQLLEMGIHGPVTVGQTEALDRVMRSQRHLLRLINEVLNLARIESGRVTDEPETISLHDVVDAVLPMVEPQLASRRLRCTVHISPDLHAYADREKVQQIVLNLLSNAAKFTPPDGWVAVDAFPDPDRHDHVALRVRDSGPGVPKDRLEDVFDPFIQLDATHTRRAEGSGLGLAISRDLARGMGGDLRARNDAAAGSSFTLTLPRPTH